LVDSKKISGCKSEDQLEIFRMIIYVYFSFISSVVIVITIFIIFNCKKKQTSTNQSYLSHTLALLDELLLNPKKKTLFPILAHVEINKKNNQKNISNKRNLSLIQTQPLYKSQFHAIKKPFNHQKTIPIKQ
jgi:hypothetical protein